jgi:hypothetical protein
MAVHRRALAASALLLLCGAVAVLADHGDEDFVGFCYPSDRGYACMLQARVKCPDAHLPLARAWHTDATHNR